MIFLLYLVFPIIEIYLLIKAGEAFGFWPVFFVVVLTAWLGSRLVKYEGFQVLTQLQQKAARGQSPHQEMLEGGVLLIGGILLIAPGFITDLFGLLCLIPFSRKFMAGRLQGWLLRKVRSGRIQVFTSGNFGGGFYSSPPPPPSTMKDVTPKDVRQIEED